MNQELVRKLLLYLVDQLQDMEAPISTIRLVKLLYLIDLEYYRSNYQTLTGIDWIKYDYGPYFFDLPNIIQSARLDLEPQEVLTSSGKGVTFRSLEPQDISRVVPLNVRLAIERILKEWAYEDTDALLKYVYDTLPVKHSTYKSPLDFTLETDHLLMEWARKNEDDFVTLDELFKEFGYGAGKE